VFVSEQLLGNSGRLIRDDAQVKGGQRRLIRKDEVFLAGSCLLSMAKHNKEVLLFRKKT